MTKNAKSDLLEERTIARLKRTDLIHQHFVDESVLALHRGKDLQRPPSSFDAVRRSATPWAKRFGVFLRLLVHDSLSLFDQVISAESARGQLSRAPFSNRMPLR